MTDIKHESTTNASDHTPGPWRISGNQIVAVSKAAGDFIVCQPYLCVTAGQVEREANARLIAAAPTMASRIQGAIDCLSQNKLFPADIEQARFLLADAIQEAGIAALPLDREATTPSDGRAA